MTKYKIIVNPTSGRGTAADAIPLLDQFMREHGLEFDRVLTEKPEHAVELAKQAALDGFDVVVVAGGDGTANEVINGLMLAKQAGADGIALGVIAIGRGNDFAFGVNVPQGLEEGCRVLLEDFRTSMDVGLVKGGLYPEGRYFGNGVGIGFDAVVGFEALKMTRLHGFLSYIVAAIKTIFLYYQAPLVRIEFNGQTMEKYALMVSIMNGRRMGGGFMMAPEAGIDDGLLDLCIAEQVSRPKIFALIPRFMQGTQAAQPSIQTGRTNSILVTALEGSLPAHADGETLCTEGQQLHMEILPRQIEIICPKQDRHP
ncbi:MAG: diacylglycerol kinase family lipid kinase [Anaerolineales bacterium]|nr:diacylglycerol kinase family lipid kinase [Anaerolineales bacterium]